MRTVSIAGKPVGKDSPAFIIAEAGVNHNGDPSIAEELVIAASEAGADAVKFQSFLADKMCGLDLSETKDVEDITGGTKSSYGMYKRLELSDEAHRKIFECAKRRGIIAFSSVFDTQRAGFLDSLGVPAFKIASGDITYLPLIRRTAETGKPLLISTGMATLDEVAEAVRCCYRAGNRDVMLLQCTSQYPPDDDEINLNNMLTMTESFGLPVGFSDHTLGTTASIAAVAMGACVIEKHFTLDRNMPGPDQKLSLDPSGFKDLVRDIRTVEKARGSYTKKPTGGELSCIFDSRRGIKAVKDIPAGTLISENMLAVIKPSSGLPPSQLDKVIGSRAIQDISAGEPVNAESIEGFDECMIATFAKR